MAAPGQGPYGQRTVTVNIQDRPDLGSTLGEKGLGQANVLFQEPLTRVSLDG